MLTENAPLKIPTGCPIRVLVRTGPPELRARGDAFLRRLVDFLNRFEAEKNKIDGDKNLTTAEKDAGVAALRKSYTAQLMQHVVDTESLAVGVNEKISVDLEKLRYHGHADPGVEAALQIERRAVLSVLGHAERIGVLVSAETPDSLVCAMLGAPIPLLSDSELKHGILARLKQVAPELLDFVGGAGDLLDSVRVSLGMAYKFITGGQQIAESALKPLCITAPDFVGVLGIPKILAAKS